MTAHFTGFQREDGRFGVRDHVLILPLSASACALLTTLRLADDEAALVSHEYESGETDLERDRIHRVFHGFATHPNVRCCIAVGDASCDGDLMQGLETYERVAVVDIDLELTPERISAAVKKIISESPPSLPVDVPAGKLIIGTECGGSDAWSGVTANPTVGEACDLCVDAGATVVLAETPELIGAEHLLRARCRTESLGARLESVVRRYEEALVDIGEDIRGAQPTVGNMAGGLTTIEEKSLGAAKKAGTSPISAIVEYAERIPYAGGVVVMDTPGHDIEQMTAMVAGGSQLVIFTTGRGTPTGCPIAPVIKVASNSALFHRMKHDLDFDAGRMLDGHSQGELAQELADLIWDVASGRLTSSERRGQRDFALGLVSPASFKELEHDR